MTTRAYLLIATGVFITAVTGSDLIARMTIAGNPLGVALAEHLHWASLTVAGIAFLFVPFVGVAFICGSANRRTKTRSAVALFVVALAVLAYFYYGGFQASQHAMLDKKWTAAALSIGLLPFFIGLPLLGVVAIAAAVLVLIDRRETVQAASLNN
jgi:hypothetical protein